MGIDKSRTRKSLVDAVGTIFSSGMPAVIFPAGRTSRKADGRLEDGPWGRMVVTQALRHERPVVPVFISGENSRLFYAVARLRRLLRVNLNVEMFLLPREVLSPPFARLDLVFGPPIFPAEMRGLASTDFARAQMLRARCYSLTPSPRGGDL